MRVSDLEKATKIFERIKVLDESIIKLDKQAIKIVEGGDISVNLTLKFIDNEEEKKKEAKNITSNDGMGFSLLSYTLYGTGNDATPIGETISEELNDYSK